MLFALAETLFVERSFLVLGVLCAVWGGALLWWLRERRWSPSAFVRRQWPGLVAAALLTAAAGSWVDGSFKVLADETNQVNTARSLALTGKARGPLEGVYVADGTFREIHGYVPKRPLLFPFLGQLVQRVAGENWRTLFGVNLAVLFGLLVLAYGAGERVRGRTAGLAAQLLVVGNPVVMLMARSAGFDLFSAFWLVAGLAAVWVWLREPTEAGLLFLWAQFLMLAHIRYENILYGVLVMGCLLLFGRLRRVWTWRAWLLAAASPPLLLPLGWQLVLSRGQYENPRGVPLFGTDHFVANAGRFQETQLDFNFAFQSAFSDLCVPLFFVSVAVLAAAGMRGVLKWGGRWQRDAAVIAGLCLFANLVVFLGLVHGDVGERISQRFFLTAFLFFSVVPVGLLLLPGWEVRRWLLLAFAGVQFGMYFPVAAEREAHGLYYPDVEAQIAYLEGFAKEKTLVVAPLPDRLCALGYGAVRAATFNAERRWFLEELKLGTWEDVIVFQEVDSVERRVLQESRLHPGLELERAGVVHLEPGKYMKISRGR